MITAGDVYKAIDEFAPFSTQEKWDNSGLLVGDSSMVADRIYVTIDISNDSIEAAKAVGAQMIVAHHPIIFSPMKNLAPFDPVWKLAAANMAAICVHTPLDMAPEGINARLYNMLSSDLKLGEITASLEDFGWIAESHACLTSEELGAVLKETFGCTVVRYTGTDKPLKKIAVCGGSGGSLLDKACALGCDAFITGDVKHDRWYAAKNMNIALFDCGHYHTERISADILAAKLRNALPEAQIIVGDLCDPVSYIYGGKE